MEHFDELKWAYNSTPIPEEEKINFYYSFSDLDVKTNDILFCHLNEIDPDLVELLDEELNISTQNCFDEIIDPRNNEIIINLTNDFSDKTRFQRRNYFFNNFPQSSTLTKEEHSACIRFLKAKRQKIIPKVEDVMTYNETRQKRENEYKNYIEFIKTYILAKPSNSFKELENLYRILLKYFGSQLIEFPNFQFSLQTAIPILENISFEASVNYKCCPKLIEQNGYFPNYKEDFKIYKMRINLKKYLNNLNEFVPNHLLNLELESCINYDLKITEEALLLILETTSNMSEEFEIPFEIGNHFIKIAQPLPSRFINLKTNLKIFEILFRNFLNLHHSQSFVEYQSGKIVSISKNNENKEIDAVNLSQNYKLKSIDEFLVMNYNKLKSSVLNSKLTFSDSDQNVLNVIIDFRNVGFLNNKNEIINLSYKLEYKKKFGLEKMTLSELLTEYIRTYFIPNASTIRNHIDVDSFEVLHSTNITKSEICNEILELYQINMVTLINKFYEFANMLRKFPEGKYILKYEKKFKDKFIIYCLQGNSKNSKTMSIQSLYEKSGLYVDIPFILIDNTKCTESMHERLSIAPGCFPPWGRKKGKAINNDREKLIKKAQAKKEELQKQLELKKKKRKRVAKRAKRNEKRKLKCPNKNLDDCMDEADLDYANQLIEKYAKNLNEKEPGDYISLKNNSDNKTVEVKEEFSLEKYLLDAAGLSSNKNNFTREDYLEMKKEKNTKFLNSSEIKLRKVIQ